MGKYKFQTRTIHGDKPHKNSKNALNSPIYQTSTFTFDNPEHARKVMSFESNDYVYTRGNNPTLRLLEERVASLEDGKAAVTFSSGMAAISSVLLSLLNSGDKMIAHKTLYGSAHSFIKSFLPRYGIDAVFANLTDAESIEKLFDSNVKVLYFETPSNPTLDIVDIAEISKIAHKHNCKVVIDNTFASPFFQKPLNFGADVVAHSATKFLNGHGDVIAGIAVSNDVKYIHYLKFEYMCELGGVLNPFDAWLILRGLKTLALRMKEHNKNASLVADFLHNHPKVKKVYYPGLADFKGHEIAKKQMSGFGAIIGFEVKGNNEQAEKVVSNLKLAKLAVSLGDSETLVEFPAGMTHFSLTDDELTDIGLSKNFIRIAVGLEDADDIINDFDNALKGIK